MRAFPVLALVALVVTGCAIPIPARDDFGASALVAVREVPPGFAEFNRFEAETNIYVIRQLCATPHQHLQERTMEASPGQLEQLIARCRTHVPLFGS